MTNPSTISDLRAALKDVEEKKRLLDEQHRALVTTLRYFEGLDDGSKPQPRHPEHTPAEMRDAIEDILSLNSPLHRREIHDRLVKMGVSIGGQDSVSNVSAHLSLDPRFENVDRGLWALTGSSTERGQEESLYSEGSTGAVGSDDISGDDEDEGDLPW